MSTTIGMQGPDTPNASRGTRAGIRRWAWLIWAAFTGFFIWSSIDFNDKVPLDDWKHDLRADASGYYIYLPGTFHHGMRAEGVSDSLRQVAGLGFTLDQERDRIVTKYTCGPAILMLPFYLIAELIDGWGTGDGWGRTHHRAIEAGGIVYWSLGLLLLAMALQRWRPVVIVPALLTIAAVAFGTNTFYYAFRSPGYSHVYSFFLVCLALYTIHTGRREPMRPPMRWLFLFACALIVLIRPVDIVVVFALLGLLALEHREEFRSPRFYLQGVLAALVVASPQLIYWRFVHGSWVVYSYGDEGFSNWASPMLCEVLMAPGNGLLPHAPVLFLLPVALAALWRHDRRRTLIVAAALGLVVYSFAAWHAWAFGCGYGMRPFVQYVPLAAIPLWALFAWLKERVPPVFWVMATLATLVCFVNYRAMLQYDVCYLWDPYDWVPYGRNIYEAFFGKMPG